MASHVIKSLPETSKPTYMCKKEIAYQEDREEKEIADIDSKKLRDFILTITSTGINIDFRYFRKEVEVDDRRFHRSAFIKLGKYKFIHEGVNNEWDHLEHDLYKSIVTRVAVNFNEID